MNARAYLIRACLTKEAAFTEGRALMQRMLTMFRPRTQIGMNVAKFPQKPALPDVVNLMDFLNISKRSTGTFATPSQARQRLRRFFGLAENVAATHRMTPELLARAPLHQVEPVMRDVSRMWHAMEPSVTV